MRKRTRTFLNRMMNLLRAPQKYKRGRLVHGHITSIEDGEILTDYRKADAEIPLVEDPYLWQNFK